MKKRAKMADLNGIGDQGKDGFDQDLDDYLKNGAVGTTKKSKRKKWGKKKKLITGGVALVLVLLLVSNIFGSKKEMPTMVLTAPLVKGEIKQTLTINGPISGTDSVDVVSNLHVEILDISVSEGDKVEKDQLLATLDSNDIAKELEMAQNSYNLAVSTYDEKLRETQSSYAKSVQDYNTAKANFDRNQVLYNSGDVPLVELENAKNAMNDAQRVVSTFTISDGKPVVNDSYSLEVEKAKFQVEQKQRELENTQVKSPIAGTVVRVNSKIGRFADKTEDDKPMFIIDNLDVLEMEIPVSEYSIGNIKMGQKANIMADILGEEIVTGEVVAISPTGEEKGGGSTERVIPITIRIVEDNTKLIAGITAKAEVIMAEAIDTYVIPLSSLIQNMDGTISVAKLDADNTIKLLGVQTGLENDFQVEVFAKEGESFPDNAQIITNPSANFTDGMAVMVMPTSN